jgi:DNA-binding GntR family transcriptional regulator
MANFSLSSRAKKKGFSKQQLAYESIKEAIIRDELGPEQLLSCRELSIQIGISRTPVMEALRRLAYEGFANYVPDKGMFVSKVRFEDVLELFEIREGLEGIAAKLCAARRTHALILQMDACLKAYEKEFREGNYSQMANKDTEFHLLILSGARNLRMENYLKLIIDQSRRGVFLSATDPERIENCIMVIHRRILAAITAGDGVEAEKAIREHLAEVQGFFKRYQYEHHYSIA